MAMIQDIIQEQRKSKQYLNEKQSLQGSICNLKRVEQLITSNIHGFLKYTKTIYMRDSSVFEIITSSFISESRKALSPSFLWTAPRRLQLILSKQIQMSKNLLHFVVFSVIYTNALAWALFEESDVWVEIQKSGGLKMCQISHFVF